MENFRGTSVDRRSDSAYSDKSVKTTPCTNTDTKRKTYLGAFLITVFVSMVTHAQTDVYSNIVGYQRVGIPSNGFALVSSPFDAGTNASVQEVVGPQLTGNTGIAAADQILFWDQQASKYVQLYLHSILEQWVDTSAIPNIIATNEIANGQGFWFGSVQSSNQSVVIVGDVVVDDAITNAITPGLQLLSYPYSTDIPLNESGLTNGLGGGFADSDHVVIWDASTQTYKQFYLHPTLKLWVDTSVVPNIIATNILHTGEGFWYERNVTAGNFDWIEDRPYALP